MDDQINENPLEARAELPATPAAEAPPASVKYTYPDGCEVYGVPPFPEMSPLEVHAQALREESAGLIANQQAGAIAAAEAAAKASQPTGIVTADQVQQSPDPLSDTPAA